MYQALYRKWRPTTFGEVIGQEHVTTTLKKQVASDHLSHAYLFIGSRGTGKTTCARILARAANCENLVDGEPCGKCSACVSILEGSAPEVVEIDAASNNGVDDVRALRDEAVYSPATIKKRVYIIDEVHMLSKPAFNALLKILEEPPKHLLFVLATTELNKVPATILSRCQRFNFKRINSEVLGSYIKSIAAREEINLTEEASRILAGMADGGVRDALSLLDQCASEKDIDAERVYTCLGLAGNSVIYKLFDDICSQNCEEALQIFNDLWINGKDPSSILNELCTLIRNILIVRYSPKSGASVLYGSNDINYVRKKSESLSAEYLVDVLDLVMQRLTEMRQSQNPKITAELCLVSLCDESIFQSNYFLEKRVSKLESLVASEESPIDIKTKSNNVRSSNIPNNDNLKKVNPSIVSNNDVGNNNNIISSHNVSSDVRNSSETVQEIQKNSGLSSGSEHDVFSWENASRLVATKLSNDLKYIITDGKTVNARFENGVLWLFVLPGFFFKRLNTQDNVQKIENIIKEQYKIDIKVIFKEMNIKSGSSRDIEELRKYDIVKFK